MLHPLTLNLKAKTHMLLHRRIPFDKTFVQKMFLITFQNGDQAESIINL